MSPFLFSESSESRRPEIWDPAPSLMLWTPNFAWKKVEPQWTPKTQHKLGFKPTTQYHIRAALNKLIRHFPRFFPLRNRHIALTAAGSTSLDDACIINRLPPELIYEISKYLSMAGLMALRITSRRLLSLINCSGSDGDLDEFHGLLRRGRFFTACEMDRAGNLHPSHMLCSSCMVSHERNLFSPIQKLVANEDRVCIGLERRLLLCEHKSFTFKELQVCRETAGFLNPDFACSELSHDSGPSAHHPAWAFALKSGEITLTRRFCLMHVPAGANIEHYQVIAAMSKVYVQICPHLWVHNPSCFRGSLQFTHFVPHNYRSSVACDYGYDRCWCSPDYHCPNRHCDTRFFFTRFTSPTVPNEEDLVLTIRRSVGHLASPVDPRWLAQISPFWGPEFEQLCEAQLK